jgi:hypothetical protein
MTEANPSDNARSLARTLRLQHGSPGQVDQMLRSVLQMCWMVLPEDRQTIDELETQVRRTLNRAIQDLREDSTAFEWGN